MNSRQKRVARFGPYEKSFLILLVLALAFLSACGGKIIKETEASPASTVPATPTTVPMWLGNASRSFYGTGPWSKAPLQVVWEFETKAIS